MIIEVIAGRATDILCDAIIVGVPDTAYLSSGVAYDIDQSLGGHIGSILRDRPECGKSGEITVIHTFGHIVSKVLILVGLGDPQRLTIDSLRALSGSSARAAKKISAKTAGILLPQEDAVWKLGSSALQALVEGALMGLYEFTQYKSNKNTNTLNKLLFVAKDTANLPKLQAAADKARLISESVNFARDLVNHPSSYLTPSRMADYAKQFAGTNLDLSILGTEDIRREGLEAFWAVAKGSEEPPALIVLTYRGNPDTKEMLGLIGKGITFDSGGISLKPSEGMGAMKDDMGGAAAVLATMKAVSVLKPAVNIVAVIPCAENMPSGRALKPGDVIGSLGGKTIEIISTDAEGRLILADAISYARKLGATKLIDLATLTGACVVALGKITSALITNQQEWVNSVLSASVDAGEKMWQLPAYIEYKEQIKSDIADLKNSGGRPAGAITAGLFLAEFAESTPWVHIDIAGTVTSDKEVGYNPKGATGVGVRTLISLIES